MVALPFFLIKGVLLLEPDRCQGIGKLGAVVVRSYAVTMTIMHLVGACLMLPDPLQFLNLLDLLVDGMLVCMRRSIRIFLVLRENPESSQSLESPSATLQEIIFSHSCILPCPQQMKL